MIQQSFQQAVKRRIHGINGYFGPTWGGINLELESNQSRFNSRWGIYADKVNEDWKIRIRPYFNYNTVDIQPSESAETVTSRNHRHGVDSYAIKSLTEHWSTGVFGTYFIATGYNIRHEIFISPGIEYSLFPYSEATRKAITFTYQVGYGYYDYYDETIFSKMNETLFNQQLKGMVNVQQPWGSVKAGMVGSNYLHDFSLHSIEFYGQASVRLFEGFALSVQADYEVIRALLTRFFLSPFSQPEFHSFTFSNDDFKLNPIYNFASQIFEDLKSFHEQSESIAKLLYELSTHPNIKSGDLFVACISGLTLADEVVDAVGIFKSENRHAFLHMEHSENSFSLQPYEGIHVDKLDKGALIFNTYREDGYRVCIVDKSNKSGEAHYWKDSFLQLKSIKDDYHQTKDIMNITKEFVSKHLTEEFEVSKADQIDILNRSVQYFKSRENFDKSEFEEEIFHEADVIESFRNFDSDYREANDVTIADNFDISTQAVKKQARIFKSVLKLDKNFHIYIHGNRNLIEKGEDDNLLVFLFVIVLVAHVEMILEKLSE